MVLVVGCILFYPCVVMEVVRVRRPVIVQVFPLLVLVLEALQRSIELFVNAATVAELGVAGLAPGGQFGGDLGV